MADRYPLVFNQHAKQFQELQPGDDLDLGNAEIKNASGISIGGSITAGIFYGDGSQLTGIDATALKDSNGTVRVQANTSGAVVTGILTATSFEGDGSQLTGIDATALKDSNGTVRVQANTSGAVVTGIVTASNGFNLGISSTGTSITNGGAVTTLNFVGAGNSISYDSGTRTVDISISSGSDIVIVDGGNFNSASSVAGAGSEINGGEFT